MVKGYSKEKNIVLCIAVLALTIVTALAFTFTSADTAMAKKSGKGAKHKITGYKKVSTDQLVRFYKKSGHKYPAYYKSTDTPTLKDFCKAYIKESKSENINAKVAFAQAMLETGWLKFGGSVSIKQHNFAGLGATGGSVKGNKFKTVRGGIRAQIQHLKAYANDEPLNKKCVDKRFSYVERGCSPYVEWLGIGDNPKGNGWCAGSGYGYSLMALVNKI